MVISRWARVSLALLGLVVVFLAVLALLYAFAPTNHVVEQVPVAPTFFAPPPG